MQVFNVFMMICSRDISVVEGEFILFWWEEESTGEQVGLQ